MQIKFWVLFQAFPKAIVIFLLNTQEPFLKISSLKKKKAHTTHQCSAGDFTSGFAVSLHLDS